MIKILRPDGKYAETLDELFYSKIETPFYNICIENMSISAIFEKIFGSDDRFESAELYYFHIRNKRRRLATFWEYYNEYLDGLYQGDGYGSLKLDVYKYAGATLYSNFYQKWNNSVTIFLNTERDALAPYNMNIDEQTTDDLDSTNDFTSNDTQTLKGITTGNESNQNTQNVYGFNSDTPVPSDTGNSTHNQSTNVDNTNTGNHTSKTVISRSNPTTRDITRKGSIGNIPNQDLVIRELELQRRRLQEMIYNDLDTLFVRSMYKDYE